MVKWSYGFLGNKKADAQKIYDEINSIGERYTPKDVVNLARDESTELHKMFDWNDFSAAEKWRESQARYIIRSIVVTEDEKTGKEFSNPIRAIVSTNERTKEYEPIRVTVTKADSYERLLNEAIRELRSFEVKYKTLKELEPVFDAVHELIS